MTDETLPASMHSTVLAVLHDTGRVLSSSWHVDDNGRVRREPLPDEWQVVDAQEPQP